MKVKFYLVVSLALAWVGTAVKIQSSIQPVYPFDSVDSVGGLYLAQTQSQAQAQFILKLIHKIINHFFPLPVEQLAKVGWNTINCIDKNESKIKHAKRGQVKVKGGVAGGAPETGQMMPILGPNGKPLNLNAFFGSDFFSQLESEEMDFVHTFLSQLGDLDDD